MQRGYLPEAAIECFFAGVSLGVLPYTEASQTGVGSTAVGYGVPVVVSRVGGLPELALDASYLVEPGDDAALAEAILRHVDDDSNVRRQVVARLAIPRSWAAASSRSVLLYEELIRTRC
jgi:glycosyltransferase involved in cell wall biosynthesis